MRNLIVVPLFAFMAMLAGPVSAGRVEARLSSYEAFVGMPVTLRISIADAEDYRKPTMPKIDGCDIRSAGIPSQSSRITIINGRRSESRSVTIQYQITPRREGTFTIPSLEMDVDGQIATTSPLRFVATKSVTGDLLFAEIEGGKEKVFVGQPLDLTLKIWMKPYHDTKHNLTCSEGDMWRTISQQTSWGGFTARMKELAENNQRPAGREVLRDDAAGHQRNYYLYEIGATVYPKRPGNIDADDLQIVVNYPTSLGKSRSPFGSFFEDSPLGGSSPTSRMMSDDFFGSSFGNRLVISATRPIVGEVSVDATQVMPVPSEGRPDDYRGAVGSYRIVTQATPSTVDAGDPITLNIGIQGTGPMELVQAPPLHQLPTLTPDFKVTDESLAGFAQGDTKIFSTTIRPRREGISEIPPIRFSFFDPETQSYRIAMSEPISITVNKSESLALDAIVGKSNSSGDRTDTKSAIGSHMRPDFTNSDVSSVLVTQSPSVQRDWWWMFVILPPIVWLASCFARHRNAIAGRLASFRSSYRRCLSAIECAKVGPEIAAALTAYISRRSGEHCETASGAMGVLRSAGMSDLANAAESYLQSLEIRLLASPLSLAAAGIASEVNESARTEAIDLLNELEKSFSTLSQSRVRLPKRHTPRVAGKFSAQRSLSLLLGVAIAISAGDILASESMVLSATQRQTILDEAGQAYARAIAVANADSAEANELFETAADKYQLLVDSGIQNSELYSNLGNAYLQSGELGRAIANYERAMRLDPNNRQLLTNLQFANSRVSGPSSLSREATLTPPESLLKPLRDVNNVVLQMVGKRSVIWILVTASLIFWGLLIARTAGCRIPLWRCAAAPLLILLGSFGSIVMAETAAASPLNAVIVADNASLHAGDGEQFDELACFEKAQGQRIEVIGRRGGWVQVRTAADQVGWIENEAVELLLPGPMGW